MPHAAARRVARAAACAALALGAAAAHAQVYKWVDDKGRTHYGEKPPEGAKASEVARPVPPSDPKAVQDPEAWRRMELEARKQRLERQRQGAREEAQEARAAAERERRCRNARVALDRLDNVQGLYRYDEKGGRRYYTDAERDDERRKAKAAVAENC